MNSSHTHEPEPRPSCCAPATETKPSCCAPVTETKSSCCGGGEAASCCSPARKIDWLLWGSLVLVAAGIAWKWVLSSSGVANQVLSAFGLDDVTRAWLGDFDTALPAVGIIGAWVLIGLCTVLLLTGMSKIDIALYESARLDGAGSLQEFRSITLPSLRQEIGVCITVTVIAALASFDIVYIATGGGPGGSTAVPGLEIYQLAFAARQVGLASALAVVLFILVLACVLPIQRLARGDEK